MQTSRVTRTPASTAATNRTAPVALAAFVAATGFGVEGVISLVHRTGDSHWDALSQVLNGAYAVAAVALVCVLPTVGRWLLVNRLGMAGVVAAQVGFAAMAVESVVSGVHDGNTLGGVFFGGLVLSLIGLLVLGITALIAGHLRWAAPLPFAGMLVGIGLGDHGGAILLGAVWVVIGTALARDCA